jgi:hypothetical protein
MSNRHTLEPVADALTGIAGRVIATISQRHAERMFARFSAHRLRDIGLDRDWDGSVYRPADRI